MNLAAYEPSLHDRSAAQPAFPMATAKDAATAFVDSPPAESQPAAPKVTAEDAATAFVDSPTEESRVPGVIDPWALPQPQPKAQPKQRKETLQDKRARLGLRPGQLDNSLELIHRKKELAGRRSYLQNFWYAVGE